MKQTLIFLLLLVSSVSFAQKYTYKAYKNPTRVIYTIPVDTTQNVTGFEASDGFRFYIIKESAGDDCIKALAGQPELIRRADILDKSIALIEEKDREHALAMGELQLALDACILRAEKTQQNYLDLKKIQKDSNTKKEHWEKMYKKEKTKKWASVITACTVSFATAWIVKDFTEN